MKKAMLMLLCSIIMSTLVFSQNRRQYVKQRIYEQKIEFIKSQVQLTPEEEKAFWPLYNDYRAKKDAIREQFKDVRKKFNQGNGSDANYVQYNDMMVQIAVSDATLLSSYYKKLKKVLPPQKIYQLFQAEKNFKKELLDKVTEGKNGFMIR